MISAAPVTLEGHGVRLEPLAPEHRDGLAAAAADGRLWELWYTSVPAPDETAGYIAQALAGQAAGTMLAWAVRELTTDAIVGSTRFHDIVAAIDRVEIGWTWYGASCQRSHVNTACKLLLVAHAFESLGCEVVGLRTDNFNFASQRAIDLFGRSSSTLEEIFAAEDQALADLTLSPELAASLYAFDLVQKRAKRPVGVPDVDPIDHSRDLCDAGWCPLFDSGRRVPVSERT